MNDVRCPRCGGSVPPNAAFCGLCGAPIAAQQPPQQPTPPPPPPPAESAPAQGWQQPPQNQPLPPPPNQPLPPPTYYPIQGAGPKILGNNTKWALGLGAASLFCCGPVTGIIGIIMAKKDMDDIAAGRAPQLDETWAKAGFYINIVALALFVVGICLFFGAGAGLRRF